MRNIKTREGYEFWDRICAVQSYAFLLSPDGRRVVKTPDIGDWIDKHEAQVIVDHAQEEFNVVKAEREALQLLLNNRDDLDDQLTTLEQRRYAEQQAREAAERRAGELSAHNQLVRKLLGQAKANLKPGGRLAKAIEAALNPTAEAVSHE
ncbi:hypothetical protein [Pseudomonas rhizophila]